MCALCVALPAVRARAAPPAATAPSATTTRPAATTTPGAADHTTATTRPADGPQRIDLPSGGWYWLQCPPGYTDGAEPALIVCLHGTDDSAMDALRFWSTLGPAKTSLWAAPQAVGHGWAETDLVRLRETWADLQRRVTFDRRRVWLAGFSAGGAMTFHWLYRERFPATAAATLANYLPPAVASSDITASRDVPIFYGVGMEDVNQERMRAGLLRLRHLGVRVHESRPHIGHTLSPDVGRAALAWFEQTGRDDYGRRLDAARDDVRQGRCGGAAMLAERIVAQRAWHDDAIVAKAETLAAEAQAPGRTTMSEADALIRAGRAADAVGRLVEVERTYAGTALGADAAQRRQALEADPAVRAAVDEAERQRREQTAMDLYLDAQRRIVAGDFSAARQDCQIVVTNYGDTRAAALARRLLAKLPSGVAR